MPELSNSARREFSIIADLADFVNRQIAQTFAQIYPKICAIFFIKSIDKGGHVCYSIITEREEKRIPLDEIVGSDDRKSRDNLTKIFRKSKSSPNGNFSKKNKKIKKKY